MHQMTSIDTNTPDPAITQAARELVDRYGDGTVAAAADRSDKLAWDGRWPEHAIALRILTAVEQLVLRP